MHGPGGIVARDFLGGLRLTLALEFFRIENVLAQREDKAENWVTWDTTGFSSFFL